MKRDVKFPSAEERVRAPTAEVGAPAQSAICCVTLSKRLNVSELELLSIRKMELLIHKVSGSCED